MTTAIWAGRLEGKADDLFREFNDSLPFDRVLVREDIEGSIAWSKAIMRAKVITPEEQSQIEAALGEILVLAQEDPHRSSMPTMRMFTRGSSASSSLAWLTWARSCTPAAAAMTRSPPTCGYGRRGACAFARPNSRQP